MNKPEYTFRMGEMIKAFEKKHPTLSSELTSYVNASLPINNDAAYNEFIHGITDIIARHEKELKQPTPIFDEEITWRGKREPNLPTPWGLVYYWKTDVKKQDFHKDLVVAARGILGFEDHWKKIEELEVLEGLCISLSSIRKTQGWQKNRVTVTIMQPGDRCILEPDDEHGIIALTDCVIREDSIDSGDDLNFIFNSEQVIQL